MRSISLLDVQSKPTPTTTTVWFCMKQFWVFGKSVTFNLWNNLIIVESTRKIRYKANYIPPAINSKQLYSDSLSGIWFYFPHSLQRLFHNNLGKVILDLLFFILLELGIRVLDENEILLSFVNLVKLMT